MFKKAQIYLVIISALLFVVHQYLQLLKNIQIPFLDNYLDPAVMMPIMLHLLMWERRILFRNKSLLLANTHIFGYLLLAILFGEILFPLFNPKFTADYWDVLSYASGTAAYVLAQHFAVSKKLPIEKGIH